MKQIKFNDWIIKLITSIIPSVQIDYSISLRESGLTSLKLVNLVVSIEDQFQIQFTPEEITGDGFFSVISICDLVARKVALTN